MSTAIRLPLRAINAEVIKDLQEKYPDAETRFWEVITLLDWSKEGDDNAVLEPALTQLAAAPVRHLFEFADILSEKLYTLDARAYAKNIGEDAWSPDRYFSVDNFLYARAGVVANGKKVYEKVLQNPELMPKDITFEALLYLPSDAYERKTGKKLDYVPAFSIETYSNKIGWKK